MKIKKGIMKIHCSILMILSSIIVSINTNSPIRASLIHLILANTLNHLLLLKKSMLL